MTRGIFQGRGTLRVLGVENSEYSQIYMVYPKPQINLIFNPFNMGLKKSVTRFFQAPLVKIVF